MKQITLLLLLLICSCKSYDPKLFPRLNKEDSKLVLDFFDYIHKGKEFDIKNLKRIEEIQQQKYFIILNSFRRTRYIASKDIVLYVNISDSKKLCIRDLSTGEDKELKKFPQDIYKFDLNYRKNKIVLQFNNTFEVYSFPSFKLLEKIETPSPSYPIFDSDTDKIYYKSDNYSISSLFEGQKELLFKFEIGAGYNLSYRLLPNKDIYIKLYRYNHGQKNKKYLPKFINFLINGKGWWEHFLLSNPKKQIKPPTRILTVDK